MAVQDIDDGVAILVIQASAAQPLPHLLKLGRAIPLNGLFRACDACFRLVARRFQHPGRCQSSWRSLLLPLRSLRPGAPLCCPLRWRPHRKPGQRWRPCEWAGREKKTLGASERNEEAQAAWRDQLNHLGARKLIVLDECGSNIGLTPLYARAPKGLRVYGNTPRNRGKNTTLIAALTFEGMGESMIIEGAANAVAFERYVEELLAPNLMAGQIVIIDNLAAPKGKKVEQLIQDKECQLLFLPAYSPDFSPIEETFSKLKTYLRRAGARTREALQEAICQALLTVSAQDAQGWFRHCGYLPAKEAA